MAHRYPRPTPYIWQESDVLILCSDGIVVPNHEDEVFQFKTCSVDTICDELILRANQVETNRDDKTVMALRGEDGYAWQYGSPVNKKIKTLDSE